MLCFITVVNFSPFCIVLSDMESKNYRHSHNRCNASNLHSKIKNKCQKLNNIHEDLKQLSDKKLSAADNLPCMSCRY